MSTLLAHAVRDAAAARRRPTTTGPAGRPRGRRHRRTFAENTWTGQQIIAGHAFRAGAGEDVRPDLADVEIPDGRRPVFDPDEAVALLQGHPAHARLRADSYATRMAVCAALGRFVGEDAMAVASHDVIAQRASACAGYRIARATAGDHVRALEDAGAVIVAFRGRSAAVAGRNLASVYVVTAPADTLSPRERVALAELTARLGIEPGDATSLVGIDQAEVDVEDEQGPSLGDKLRQHPFRAAFDLEEETTLDRMTGNFSCSEPMSALPVEGRNPAPMTGVAPSQLPRTPLPGVTAPPPATAQRSEHPEVFTARTAGECRMAAAWLIHRLGWTYTAAAEAEMVVVCRDFFAAGWPALALEHAFDQRPDGSPYPGPLPAPHNRDRAKPVRVYNVWGLLTDRLCWWREEPPAGRRFGRPLPPPIKAETPRRGRPPGAVTRRRALVHRVEQLPVSDPRRVAALAVLSGYDVSVSWRPRSPQAAAAIAAIRQSTPETRRKADLRELIGTDGTGASAGAAPTK
jgi:hypothetical protein